MPLPLMVRLDDDVAEKLRDRSLRTHVPMNRIINDAIKRMFAEESGASDAGQSRALIVSTFPERILKMRDAARNVPHAASAAVYRAHYDGAISLLFDCVEALMKAMDPTIALEAPDAAPVDSQLASTTGG